MVLNNKKILHSEMKGRIQLTIFCVKIREKTSITIFYTQAFQVANVTRYDSQKISLKKVN